jgi:hypothetical protein
MAAEEGVAHCAGLLGPNCLLLHVLVARLCADRSRKLLNHLAWQELIACT